MKSRLSPDRRKQVRRAINAVKSVYEVPARAWRRSRIKNYAPLPQGRTWRSAIPPALHWQIQDGTIGYRYRDVPMLKHPVEIALYMRLI